MSAHTRAAYIQTRWDHAHTTTHHHANLMPRTVQMLIKYLEFAVVCTSGLHTLSQMNIQSPADLQYAIPTDPVSVKSVKSFNLLTSSI